MGREGANSFSKIRSNYALNLATARNEATIDIFGVVGVWWDGVDSMEFIEEIKNLDVDKITINVSSPGGFVNDGLQIYEALRSHKAFVEARLTGLVGSIATIICCGADRVIGSDTLLYMIHNVQGGAMGTPSEIRKVADVYDKQEGILVDIYRKKTGKTKAQIQKLMDAETWFTIDEAINEGFVDAKGDGFSFEHESSPQDLETRNFLTNALNCANVPEMTANSQLENEDIMNDLTKEEKGGLKALLNVFNKKEAVEKVIESTDQKNELEDLRKQVQELTNKLESANKASEAANFDSIINGITNALKPQLTEATKEAANEAVEAVKTELTAKVSEVENKLNTVGEKANEVDEIVKKVEEVAKAVNTQKSLSPQPEVKKDNGEGLVDVVAPVNTFQAFVKSKASNN